MFALLFFYFAPTILCENSYTSSGITAFQWIASTKDMKTATETNVMQEDCARRCLSQCNNPKEKFCHGFAFENQSCVIFNASEDAAKYTAFYSMSNYMNAISKTKEGCPWSYDYEEVPAKHRQTVFCETHYVLFAEVLNNGACQSKCRAIGFDQVSIHTEEEVKFLGDLHDTHGTSFGIFIGLHRNETNRNNWYWRDGTKFVMNEDQWVPGQPDDLEGDEDCVIQNRDLDHKWDDYPCYAGMNCLCARPVTRNKYCPIQ